jgi:hypothetical protein
VPVHRGQREADARGGIGGAVHDHGPDLKGLPLDRVAGGDLLSGAVDSVLDSVLIASRHEYQVRPPAGSLPRWAYCGALCGMNWSGSTAR